MGEPRCEHCEQRPAFEVAPGAFLCQKHVQRLLLRSLAESGLAGGATLLDPSRPLPENVLRVTNLLRIQPIMVGQLELAPSFQETAERMIERSRWALAERMNAGRKLIEGVVEGRADEVASASAAHEAKTLGRFAVTRLRSAVKATLGLGQSRTEIELLRDLASNQRWVSSDPFGARAERLLAGHLQSPIESRLRPMLAHWAEAVGIDDATVGDATAGELGAWLRQHIESRWDFVATALYWANESDPMLREVRYHRCVDRSVSPRLAKLIRAYFDEWTDHPAGVVFDFGRS